TRVCHVASSNASPAAARRYAAAFITTAAEANAFDSVEKDIADLRAMLAGSGDLQTFVRSPLIKEAEQGAAIAAIADKAGLHALTRNFLFSLVKNRRLALLDSVLAAAQAELGRRRGEIEARVVAAQALSAAQTKELQAAI